MNAAEVLSDLQGRGVALAPEGNRLRWWAPRGAMTPELVERLRQCKPALLALLSRAASATERDRTDWRSRYEERAAMIEHDGGVLRRDAEARAFECAIVEWLNRNPAPSAPDGCADCGKPEEAGAVVVPYGTGRSGHTWLHPGCWTTWHARRRAEATRALAAVGVASPQ